MVEYRLISVYVSPECTYYVLQCRAQGDEWKSLHTVPSNELPQKERDELFRRG